MFYSSLENGYGKARDPDANRSRQYARHSAGAEPADAPANKNRQRACILQKNFIKSSKCDYGFQSYQIDFFQNISLTLCQSLQK